MLFLFSTVISNRFILNFFFFLLKEVFLSDRHIYRYKSIVKMKEPKSKILNVRFTENQSQKIMEYLSESKVNYKTKSEFIRNMILNKIGRKVEIPVEG
jgi:hypothetical protein